MSDMLFVLNNGLLQVHHPNTLTNGAVSHDCDLHLRVGDAAAGHSVEVTYRHTPRTLAVRRNYVGIPAFYYSRVGKAIIASTDLSWLVRERTALTGTGPTLDAEGLALYLAYQYVPAPWTIWSDIEQLTPGHRLEATADGTIREFPDEGTPSHGDTIDPYEVGCHALELHEASLRRQVDTSGPLAALLSGGMDTSTNLAVLVERMGLRPVVYTASFPESQYDESYYAAVVAKHFGLDHKILHIQPAGVEALVEIVTRFDQPHGDRAIYAQHFLCQVAATDGHRQLVTGEGGDEIMGYPRTRAGEDPLTGLPADAAELARFYLEKTCLAAEPLRREVFGRLEVDPQLPYLVLERIYRRYAEYDPFERLYFGQWKTWMAHGVYVKDATLAYGSGLWPVVPFMNAELMEFMARLPADAKRKGLADKNFLKTALRGSLPRETLEKPKQKFWLQFAEWFRSEWTGLVRETLLAPDAWVTDHFGAELPRRLVDEHKSGMDHNRLLWALLFLELWGRGARA
jgi:asparagine synthase (glutamine-hydrolysing)